MEKIKITKPRFLYNITTESGELIKDKEIKTLFNDAIKLFKKDLESKGKKLTTKNIFSDENINLLKSHFDKKFPGVEINLEDFIKEDLLMGDMDDIIEIFNEKVQTTMQPLKDKINDLEISNQELVNSNQELVNSNQELVKEIEMLRNKKNIPVQLFLDIKKKNPYLSDEEALNLAKKQIDNLDELF